MQSAQALAKVCALQLHFEHHQVWHFHFLIPCDPKEVVYGRRPMLGTASVADFSFFWCGQNIYCAAKHDLFLRKGVQVGLIAKRSVEAGTDLLAT